MFGGSWFSKILIGWIVGQVKTLIHQETNNNPNTQLLLARPMFPANDVKAWLSAGLF